MLGEVHEHSRILLATNDLYELPYYFHGEDYRQRLRQHCLEWTIGNIKRKIYCEPNNLLFMLINRHQEVDFVHMKCKINQIITMWDDMGETDNSASLTPSS